MRTGRRSHVLARPRSTLNRLCRILAQYELIDLSRRGQIALGPAALTLGSRREDSCARVVGDFCRHCKR